MVARPNFEVGQSTYRPLGFNGQYYDWSKTCMHDFIMVEDSELWDIICDGPHVLMKKLGETRKMVPKNRKEYSDIDKKAVEKNFRAKKILEIWEALQTAHEGTTQIKQSKIDMLTTEYELVRLKDDESIQDMHTRFTSIINELHSLREVIPRNKLVRKVLSVLRGSWESKVNVITEAKDLQTLTMDELIGNLKTYEMKRQRDNERREPKKEKNLMLKAKNNYSSEEDSDMAYLIKRFQKMVRRNGGIPKRGSTSKPRIYDLCHNCGKPGRKSAADNIVKQALTTWGDSSSESEGELYAENSSMMAVENEAKEYDSLLDNDKEALTIELEMLNNREMISLSKEKNALEEKIADVEQARDDFLVVITDLEETIKGLKSEHRHVSIEKGKGVASETHIKLEKELNDMRTSICGELEKNRQLQAELKKVKIDLEKSFKCTWSSDAVTAVYFNTSGNRVLSIQKNKVFAEKGTVRRSKLQWIKDSGCSKHMTGNTMDFLSLKALQGGNVKKSLSHSIENVYYVDGLKYSLLSVSQICDKGNKVEFLSKVCTVANLVTGEVVLVAKRYKNIYVANFEYLQAGDMRCLKSVDDDAELWHRRSGHASFSLLNKLIQRDLVRGLSNSRFTWTLFLRTKDETFEVFVAFVKKIQVKIELKADMMSQMKETGEYNATSSSTSQEELGTSITTTKAEERVGDAVQGTSQVAEQGMQGNPLQCKRNYINLKETRNKARLAVQGYNQEEGIL
ncbi:uncharacterized protein [Nicotiana sylvestris]|uniref:uncharacterized protein n=1 Tax=Nicotiana sylvestris TaxID=4096 RepID=UPI00388CE713